VADKLQLEWAPEQIAGWLKHTYPGAKEQQVSHETIYRSLYIQHTATEDESGALMTFPKREWPVLAVIGVACCAEVIG